MRGLVPCAIARTAATLRQRTAEATSPDPELPAAPAAKALQRPDRTIVPPPVHDPSATRTRTEDCAAASAPRETMAASPGQPHPARHHHAPWRGKLFPPARAVATGLIGLLPSQVCPDQGHARAPGHRLRLCRAQEPAIEVRDCVRRVPFRRAIVVRSPAAREPQA